MASQAIQIRNQIAKTVGTVPGIRESITGNIIDLFSKNNTPYAHTAFPGASMVDGFTPVGQVYAIGHFEIRIMVKDSKDFEADCDEYAEAVVAALAADCLLMNGSLAIDTKVMEYGIVPINDKGWCIVLLDVTVQYNYDFGNL